MDRIRKLRKDHGTGLIVTSIAALTIAALYVTYSGGIAVANEGWQIVRGDEGTDENGVVILRIVFKNGRIRYMQYL